MKWPKRVTLFWSDKGVVAVCNCGHPETHDGAEYVLAPKRKAKKKPGTGGGSK